MATPPWCPLIAPGDRVVIAPCDRAPVAPCDRVLAAPRDRVVIAPCDRVPVAPRDRGQYLEAIPPLLAAAGSPHPRSDAELLLAAADGLLVEQLATDDASDLTPRLRRLADALAKA